MQQNSNQSAAAASAELLERLGRLIRAREHEAGLNPAQWEALRYIARANRFSRHPTALTAWFGATKGTVSQTLIALEKKGLIAKERRAGRGRAVSLALTEAGQAMLARDPLIDIEAASVALGGEAERLANNLAALLRELQEMGGARSFGLCRSCRYFGARQGVGDLPHRCLLLETDLGDEEAEKICFEHEPAAA
jgi:DNA-binding MarR family transcriptional regulator